MKEDTGPQHQTREQLAREVEQLRGELARLEAERLDDEIRSSLLDHVPDPVYVHDLEGRALYVNTTACRQTGFSREELLEMSLRDKVAPGFAELIEKRLARVLEQGRGVFESSHKTRSGTAMPVEVHASVLHSAGGQLLLTVARRLSQRRPAEEHEDQGEQQYRQLFESMQDVFYRTDIDGALTLVSPSVETVFGWSPRQILGQDLASTFYYDPAERPRFLERLRVHGSVRNHRTRCKNRDGEEVWVSTNARFYRGEDGSVQGVEGISRDITDQVLAEHQLAQTMETLKRSNRDLEQFAYVASHDLQEPLRMISGFVQLLDRRYRGKLDTSADDYLDYIVEGTGRMSQQIRDLLTYSRVGREGRTFRTVDCNQVLEQVNSNLALAMEESGCELTSDPLPRVFADRSQILMLIQNLVYNAIKYRSEQAPRIHLSHERLQTHHQIAVKDNGLGIAPSFHDRIFQIFQRLHAREEYSGTGIGLALCKRIVENHGGRIWVKSREGEGATFFFTMPHRGRP